LNRSKKIVHTLVATAVLVMVPAICRAQDEPQPEPSAPPKPAGFSFPTVGNDDSQSQLQPDLSPLTGVQNSTLGIPEIRHSYWAPGLQFSSNIMSNGYGHSTGSWSADNYFIGNLSLVEAWERSMLTVNYSGGGFVSTNSQQGNGWYQQLALAHSYQSKRWLLQIFDQFSYTPQSGFGFGGGTSLGVPGAGGSGGTTIPGLGGNYTSSQNIYGVGAYYNNTSAVQATYSLTSRASLTAAASYGLLDFTEPGNYNSYTFVTSLGFNYALRAKDTIGIVYSFSSYHFPGNPQAYGTDTFSFAYGRKVTGRLAFRVFIGPQITNYRVAVGGASQTTGFSTSVNMTYALHRGGLSATYIHGLSAGSGVFIGSTTDQATFTFSRNLNRVWTGGLNFGYSRNSPVGGTEVSGYPSYDNWFAGANVSRNFGRDFSFNLAYTANISNYTQTGCTVANCTNQNTYNTMTVSFQWHPRPRVLP
jgi:hypothetical protein